MDKRTVELKVHIKGTHEFKFTAKFFEGKTLEWYSSVKYKGKTTIYGKNWVDYDKVVAYLDRVEVVVDDELLNFFVPKVNSPLRFLAL
jgi:hypothetical protein